MPKGVKRAKSSQIEQFIIRNKKGLVTLLVLLIAGAGFGIYQQYISSVDEKNVITMRVGAERLIAKLEASNQEMTWTNDSSCMIDRPNSFGEDINYACNARYVYKKLISTQQDVDDLVQAITRTLNESVDLVHDVRDNSTNLVKVADDVDQNSYYNATSFAFNGVQMNRGTCYVRYVIAETKDSVEAILECTVGTKKPYFEPIKEV